MFEDWNWTDKGLRVKTRIENVLMFGAVVLFFYIINFLEGLLDWLL
jgi:hypothetical protein